MAMNIAKLATALMFAAVAAQAMAQPASGRDTSSAPVPTVTRLVKLFLEREAQLADAIRGGDATSIGKLLADDFELRVGARAANPVPRDDFLLDMLRTRDPGGTISRMAVHDLGAVALVSFSQASSAGPLFVVDVWRQQGADWMLAIRYASPAGNAALVIPGAAPAATEIPKKY
jgi:hypothetical protein